MSHVPPDACEIEASVRRSTHLLDHVLGPHLQGLVARRRSLEAELAGLADLRKTIAAVHDETRRPPRVDALVDVGGLNFVDAEADLSTLLVHSGVPNLLLELPLADADKFAAGRSELVQHRLDSTRRQEDLAARDHRQACQLLAQLRTTLPPVR